MSRKRAVTLIIILSLILSGLLFINYNMTRPTKLNKIIASKYNAPANSAFDDQNFYNCVVDSYNYSNDALLSYTTNMSDAQLESMNSLSCWTKNIKSVKGIEKLTNLTYLYASDNQITELDVSKNVKLETLYASDNQLKSLDVSKNPNLTYLYASYNKLTSLDVSKNINLIYLDVESNQLTSLKLPSESGNKLEKLYASNNQLTSLDVSKNQNLTYLYAFYNKLTSLNVNNNINLTYLDVYDNQLTSLDVSKNPNLTDLAVSDNQLTSLDVSKNPNLTNLGVGNNQLTNLELPKENGNKLETIFAYNNKLTSLNVNNNANLTYLDAFLNKLMSLDVSKNPNLTYLNVGGNQLISLDVSKNTNLTDLAVSDNKLTSLDVNKNVNLTELNVRYNKLTSLDISKNTNLTKLDASNNQLTSLDVNNNVNLIELSAYKNQLTELDVSKNAKLECLYASNNQLTNLDVSNNINLIELDVSGNRLSSLILGSKIKPLDKLTSIKATYNLLEIINLEGLPNLEELYISSNPINEIDTSNNPKLKTLENEPMPINKNFDDANFYKSIIDEFNIEYKTTLTINDNLTDEQLKMIKRLPVRNNVYSAKGIEKLTNLTYLSADNNQLTSLDVSKNINLTYLYLYNNKLTSLDVSKNTNLTSLIVKYDQLTSLDVSKNIKLETLYVSNNKITNLDVANNVNLRYLEVSGNQFNLGTTTIYKNTFDLNEALENGNLKTNNNITKTFKYAIVNDKKVTSNNIEFDKTGTYKYRIYFDVKASNSDVETICGDYTINVILYKLLSDKYKINNEKGYIYTGQDTDSKTILSNLKIDGEEGTIEIKDNKVLIKNNDKVLREYKILNITKTDYDLSKDYIYTKITDFDINKITTNCELTNVNNTLEIGYDGEVFNTYKIVNIKSDYKIYGKWIYIVGEFDINKIIPTNATLTDNKGILEVKYNNEVIDSLTELKIDFGSLKVTKDKIVPGEIKEYTEFMKNIKSDNLEVKLYKGTTLITKGNIEEGMTLKVISSEYGEIMTYTITKEYVDVSKLEIDEKNYIKKYNVGTTYEEIRKEIETSGSVKFIDNTGKELENSDIIRTGSKVVIELSTETKEYTIVVYGDINGDGKITMSDLVKSANYLIDETIINEDCYKEAIDVTKDGNIRMSDIIKLSNILIGSN